MSQMHRHTASEGVAEPGTDLQVRPRLSSPNDAASCCFCENPIDPNDVDTWKEHAWWERQGIAPQHGLFVRPEHQAYFETRYACNSCVKERRR